MTGCVQYLCAGKMPAPLIRLNVLQGICFVQVMVTGINVDVKYPGKMPCQVYNRTDGATSLISGVEPVDTN